jgi:formate/nitrite transporter FocA (FNT family)
MYTAVWIYREKKSVWGILFCIPVFILSGFEHSVADMFYFAAAGLFSLQSFVYIFLVVLGNTLGGLCIPAVQALKGEQNA